MSLARVRLSSPPIVVGLCAAIVGTLVVINYPTGPDLSAQVARADFAANNFLHPVDFRWYGGVHSFGYSLISPLLMAWLGVSTIALLALVITGTALTAIAINCQCRNVYAIGLAGVITCGGNLVSGRVTFGLGIAWALITLWLLTGTRTGWRAISAMAISSALTGLTSPVAGLFLILVTSSVWLTHIFNYQPPRQRKKATLIIVFCAVPLGAMVATFSDGGWMNLSPSDAIRAIVASGLVAGFTWKRAHILSVAAGLSGLLVATAWLIRSPLGQNSTRLIIIFAIPALLAVYPLPMPKVRDWAIAAALIGAVIYIVPPLAIKDLRSHHAAMAQRAANQELLTYLRAISVSGRIEIPPTRNYWEAVDIANQYPLARGWLRQADTSRNPLFFDELPGRKPSAHPLLNAASYRKWLDENAVEYVAVAAGRPAWVSYNEVALIKQGLPYLHKIWANPRWQLYAVNSPTKIVSAPATVLSMTPSSITFRASASGRVTVAVHWSQWLSISSPHARLLKQGDWTAIDISRPGQYTLTSSLFPHGH